MSKTIISAAALLTAALGGVAFAQNNGDIIFTSQQADAVKLISGTTPTAPGAATLIAANTFGTSLGGITRAGDGNYYIVDGNFPVPNPSTAGVRRINNPFSGAATLSTFVQGDPLQYGVGVAYSANTNSLITVNNPFGPVSQGIADGIYNVPLNNPSAVTQIFAEPPISTPQPRYQAGMYIVQDPNSNDFFVVTENGGTGTVGTNPQDDLFPGALWRVRYNGGTNSYAVDATPVVDFGAPFTGLGFNINGPRGIAAVPGTSDLFVTDLWGGTVYKITLDGSGNYSSIALVLSGLDQPESIIYNEYTGKLVIDERGNLTNSRISTFNLDGSGFTVLYTGEHARGFAIVPAPSAVALLGMGGMVLARRRRR